MISHDWSCRLGFAGIHGRDPHFITVTHDGGIVSNVPIERSISFVAHSAVPSADIRFHAHIGLMQRVFLRYPVAAIPQSR